MVLLATPGPLVPPAARVPFLASLRPGGRVAAGVEHGASGGVGALRPAAGPASAGADLLVGTLKQFTDTCG